jgi:signal transduction histidine kinase
MGTPTVEVNPPEPVKVRDSAAEKSRVPVTLVVLPPVASGFAIGVGILVLVGWSLGLDPLKRMLPAFVAMNPATAVLFILTGTALALAICCRASRLVETTRKGLAAIVIAAALSELFELAGLWHSPVDEVLFSQGLWDERNHLWNRIAPFTAVNFLLSGLSIFMLDMRGRRLFSQSLAIVIGFVAILPITGYAYDVPSLSNLGGWHPMAFHTAAAFLVLAGGLLFAVPHAPLIEPFATNDPRGVLARRLFPLAVLLTLVLGWVCVWGERNAWFDTNFGIALYAITLSVLFVILLRWTVATVGKLEIERDAINARLHELNRRKDEMIAVVSHDLCSPLTGFRIVIDLLREREKPSEELLGLLDHSAQRMVSMVRGLLDISKLQSEKVELELEDVRVSEVVRQAIEPLAINANAKDIKVKLHPAEQEPVLRADRLRVSQIFSNLLANAVKFTSPGGAVDVTIEPTKDAVKVNVRDTGLGIPKDEMPHIFDKYRQTSTKATAGEPGAGLGLAIVREMVLLHGGRISVSSQVNRGTVFSVCLPIDPAQENEKAA